MDSEKEGIQKQAVEDYLKTIYLLAQEETPVSTSRIALTRKIKPPSVTNMLQKLAKSNFVNYRKHFGVTLTKAGTSIALNVLRKHRLVELFLTQELDFSWEEVHDEAEVLEHVISEQLANRISDRLNEPRYDPHGEPIPTKNGDIPKTEGVPLATLKVGMRGVIERINDDSNRKLLKYLLEKNIVPGSVIEIIHLTPIDGLITVKIQNSKHVVGNQIGEKVFVKAVKE